MSPPQRVGPPPKKRPSTGAKVAIAAGAAFAAVLVIVFVAALATMGDPGSDAGKPQANAANTPSTADRRLTAGELVDELSELYPLPNRHKQPNKTTGHKDDPVEVISTDPVIVYELKTEAAAKRWAKSMDGAGAGSDDGGVDARQVGRFMLSWQPDYPSDPNAVDEMTERARELVATEKR